MHVTAVDLVSQFDILAARVPGSTGRRGTKKDLIVTMLRSTLMRDMSRVPWAGIKITAPRSRMRQIAGRDGE